MSDKSCQHCGRTFQPKKKASKGLFCSHACYFAQKKSKAGVISVERQKETLDQYHQGEFIHPIARRLRTSFVRVKELLKKAGVYEQNRIRPQHVKGRRLLLPEAYAKRLILHQRVIEGREIAKFDECTHWQKHPEVKRWQSNKTAKNQYYKWRSCPTNVLKRRLRSRVNRVLRGKLKSAPTLKLLGCSLEEFKVHLQSPFTQGMTWTNYGSFWHIDHIEPCCSFDLSKPADQKRCFHYSNLRPLCATENRRKHGRIVPTQRELIFTVENCRGE
jgi:hypothetical protein